MIRPLLVCFALGLLAGCEQDAIICVEPGFGPTTLVVLDGRGRPGVTRDIDAIRSIERRVSSGPQPSPEAYRILISNGQQVHTRMVFDPAPGSDLKKSLDALVAGCGDAELVELADSDDPELTAVALRAMAERRARPPGSAAPSRP